jgi:hypothetical protein
MSEMKDKIVMWRKELQKQEASMGIMNVFDSICVYLGEQDRKIATLERKKRDEDEGFRIKMPIGDWRDDGHVGCQNFLLSSNKPVEAVREIHYRVVDRFGFDIESVCSDLEDNIIDDEDMQILIDMGYNPEGIDHDEFGYRIESPKQVAEIWVFLLMKTDPELKLTFEKDREEAEMIPFYGIRDGKSISYVGFGLF